jgi:hypothetical protein
MGPGRLCSECSLSLRDVSTCVVRDVESIQVAAQVEALGKYHLFRHSLVRQTISRRSKGRSDLEFRNKKGMI